MKENINEKIKSEFESRPKTTGPASSRESSSQGTSMSTDGSYTYSGEMNHSTISELTSKDYFSNPAKPC